MKGKIIGRGAEALLIKKGNVLLKRRIKKGYRHEHLDIMLRTSRTRKEAKILRKLYGYIPVPKVKNINGMAKKPFGLETEIEMEYIKGKLLSNFLDKFSLPKALKICKKVGQNIAKIHDKNIIHGDLTTSNMILKDNKCEVFFIDFGLGFHSSRIEDKAVDLHLLKEALESKHFKKWEIYFNAILEGYKNSENYKEVIERLKKVESRGRYKGKAKGQGPLIP